MKVIVGILTRAEPSARRQACADTWVRRLKAHAHVRPLFLVGAAAGLRLDGDTLHLPCPDTYRALAHKVHLAVRWALTQDCDYFFKCDDDTFVHAALR